MQNPILPRIAAGDAEAVGECLTRYGGLVWSLARNVLRNSTDAEEAVQDVFVEIWKQAGRFDASIASEATFVAMIARTRLIDRYRRQRTQLSTTSISNLVDPPAESSRNCPVELAEEAALARQRLAQLRPDERMVIEWSVCEGLSHKEISDRTGQPLGTVKSNLRRGLLRLRQLFVPETEKGGVK